jgi:hypothetical protein
MHILAAKRLLVTIGSRLRIAMDQKQLIVSEAKLCSKGFAINGLSGKKERHYNLTPSSVAVARKQFIVSASVASQRWAGWLTFLLKCSVASCHCVGRLTFLLECSVASQHCPGPLSLALGSEASVDISSVAMRPQLMW